MEIRKELVRFYSTSEDYLNFVKSHQKSYLRSYLPFVERYVAKGARVLELGAGPGLSSFFLSQRGYRVVGVDISRLLLKEVSSQMTSNLKIVVGDVLELPFSSSSFDTVTSLYLLEHVTDVEKALLEMMRVLRKEGLLLIRSPNLLSPYTSFIKFISILVGPGRRSSLWGETRLNSLRVLVRNCYYSLKKSISSKPNFIYREPDLNVMESDADSVYLLNQMDLRNFFRRRGLPILNLTWGRNRWRRLLSSLVPSFAPSVGLVVKKV
jgi:SAM-dependent methyltransferase